jgi:hypothetical protein
MTYYLEGGRVQLWDLGEDVGRRDEVVAAPLALGLIRC